MTSYLDEPDTGPHPSGAPAAAPSYPKSYLDEADPAETAAPEQPQLGWGDVFQQLSQGVRRGTGQVQETFGAGPQGETPAGAAPFEWSDLAHPGSGAAKIAERFGAGAPTTAMGVAGGLAGTALTGGPWGGIIGGAGGAALGSAMQTLGPVFHQYQKQGLGDQEAWSKAVDQALISGAGSGAAWSLFPVRFLKGPLFNMALQAGIIQPGVAVGTQAARNVSEGRPAGEDLGRAYTEGAVGTLAPAAGNLAIRGAGRATGLVKPGGHAAPEELTAADLKDMTNAHYSSIGSRNIAYPNHGELVNLADSIKQHLLDAGDANMNVPEHQQVLDTIDDIIKPRRGTGAVDFTTIDGVRRKLGDIWIKNQGEKGDASTARLAGMAREGIDSFLQDEQAQVRAGADPDSVRGLSGDINLARQYSQAERAAHAWEALQKEAERAPNPEKYLKTQIDKIVKEGIRSGSRRGEMGSSGPYPAKIVEFLADISGSTLWQRSARLTSAFDPHGPMGIFTSYLAHSLSGFPGLAAPAIAGLTHMMAGRQRARIPGQMQTAISSLPSDRPKMTGPPGVLKRTAGQRLPLSLGPLGAGPMPTMPGVDLSQDRKSGGKIDKALRVARAAGGHISGLEKSYDEKNSRETARARSGAGAPEAGGAGAHEKALPPHSGARASRRDRVTWDVMRPAKPDIFHRAISEGAAAHKYGASVAVHSPQEYARMRTYLSPDAKSGYALDGNNIVSLFKHPQSDNDVANLLSSAVANGGRRLDAFDTALPAIYSRFGFKATGRIPFNEEFAPPNWDYGLYHHYNNGRPDIVFMTHDPTHGKLYVPGEGGKFSNYDAADTFNRTHTLDYQSGGEVPEDKTWMPWTTYRETPDMPMSPPSFWDRATLSSPEKGTVEMRRPEREDIFATMNRMIPDSWFEAPKAPYRKRESGRMPVEAGIHDIGRKAGGRALAIARRST